MRRSYIEIEGRDAGGHRPRAERECSVVLFRPRQYYQLGPHSLDRDLASDFLGNFSECCGLRGIRSRDDNRHASVAALADFHTERYLATEIKSVFVGKFLPATLAKDLVAVSRIGRDEIGHVLDNAKHRNVDGLEHLDCPSNIGKRYFLWRSNENRSLNRYKLSERELDVAGSRRHVDNEVIEFA